jgi:hypothetical protein
VSLRGAGVRAALAGLVLILLSLGAPHFALAQVSEAAGQVRTLLDNLTADALAVGRTAGRTRAT